MAGQPTQQHGRAFATLDVFTDTPFLGNPLAVVADTDDLDETAMQAIAREFNFSETVFLMHPEHAAHSARMRIFTPESELPFAGHPTIGTAIHVGLQRQASQPNSDALIVLEQPIGIVRVAVKFRPASPPFAEFDVPKRPQELGPAASTQAIADALNLMPHEIGFHNHKPVRFGAGVGFTYVPVASLDVLAKASVNLRNWQAAFGASSHNNAYLYTRFDGASSAQYRARMFWPAAGLNEDPATGSAAAGLAGVLARFDRPTEGWHKRIIEQGVEMGRASRIVLSMEIESGQLDSVRIGGNAVLVSTGTLYA